MVLLFNHGKVPTTTSISGLYFAAIFTCMFAPSLALVTITYIQLLRV